MLSLYEPLHSARFHKPIFTTPKSYPRSLMNPPSKTQQPGYPCAWEQTHSPLLMPIITLVEEPPQNSLFPLSLLCAHTGSPRVKQVRDITEGHLGLRSSLWMDKQDCWTQPLAFSFPSLSFLSFSILFSSSFSFIFLLFCFSFHFPHFFSSSFSFIFLLFFFFWDS